MTSRIFQIYRVQNITLFRQFIAQKTKVASRMKHSSVTKTLFHGTKGDVCPQICRDGFDRGHSGENGELRNVYNL